MNPRQLIAVAGSKGGVGTTTVALQLVLAATRMAPGRPVCLVDFDLHKGDLRALLGTPHRHSVADLAVANEIGVRHLQETLYTHTEGFRVLLAPEEGEKAGDIDSTVARNVLSAVKARHALTVVDLGAVPTEATAIAAGLASRVLDRHHPGRARAARRPANPRAVDAARRACGRGRSGRAQPGLAGAEIQPDLARKVVGDTMAQTTIPADFDALEAAVNTGSPSRMEDDTLRAAFEDLARELDVVPRALSAARARS